MKINPRTEMVVIIQNGDHRLRWPCDHAIIDTGPAYFFEGKGTYVDLYYFDHVGQPVKTKHIGPVIAILGPTSPYFVRLLSKHENTARAYNAMIDARRSWNNWVPLSVLATRESQPKVDP
jgi:hypothetical protein